jgi:hypothetical protein
MLMPQHGGVYLICVDAQDGRACLIYVVARMVEQCHFTYVTKFKPTQEQICDENFEKKCQITFKQQGFNETVKKCYRPVSKVI